MASSTKDQSPNSVSKVCLLYSYKLHFPSGTIDINTSLPYRTQHRGAPYPGRLEAAGLIQPPLWTLYMAMVAPKTTSCWGAGCSRRRLRNHTTTWIMSWVACPMMIMPDDHLLAVSIRISVPQTQKKKLVYELIRSHSQGGFHPCYGW